MNRLQGKVAVITGAGRKKGLGEAIALRFAAEGAVVVLTDIGAPSGPHLTAENIGTSAEMEEVATAIRTTAKLPPRSAMCAAKTTSSAWSPIR